MIIYTFIYSRQIVQECELDWKQQASFIERILDKLIKWSKSEILKKLITRTKCDQLRKI